MCPPSGHHAELFLKGEIIVKNIVYIDGENLSYAIREASENAGQGRDRSSLVNYDYRGLLKRFGRYAD